jgi:hypothetical protein
MSQSTSDVHSTQPEIQANKNGSPKMRGSMRLANHGAPRIATVGTNASNRRGGRRTTVCLLAGGEQIERGRGEIPQPHIQRALVDLKARMMVWVADAGRGVARADKGKHAG